MFVMYCVSLFFVLLLKARHIVSEIVKNNIHTVLCLALFFLVLMCLVYLYMRASFRHLDDVMSRDITLC